MCDMEKLYRHLQKKLQYPVAYKNGQITVALPRGEVRIREKCTQLLIQGRLYEEFDRDETDDLNDLVEMIDTFAENLESMDPDPAPPAPPASAARQVCCLRSFWHR